MTRYQNSKCTVAIFPEVGMAFFTLEENQFKKKGKVVSDGWVMRRLAYLKAFTNVKCEFQKWLSSDTSRHVKYVKRITEQEFLRLLCEKPHGS